LFRRLRGHGDEYHDDNDDDDDKQQEEEHKKVSGFDVRSSAARQRTTEKTATTTTTTTRTKQQTTKSIDAIFFSKERVHTHLVHVYQQKRLRDGWFVVQSRASFAVSARANLCAFI
jgi:hypothetical protein